MKIHDDYLTRTLFATDASIYQIIPKGVVYPKDISDCKNTIQHATDNDLSITARGSGTSLAGQAVGNGLVVDFSKHMNQIVSIDIENRLATVQPGVIRDQLNKELLPYNLHFSPDPATSSRATFGGMIANNSSGTKSIQFGKTSEHLHSLKVLLHDGSLLHCENLSELQVEQKCQLDSVEGEIYRFLWELKVNHSDLIRSRYPKIMRRVSGYALDAFINSDSWNLSHLFCGSEGTLGLIVEATVSLTPLPIAKRLLVLHYNNRASAIDDVKSIVQSSPCAVEMCDRFVLDQCKGNYATQKLYNKYIQDKTDTILIVEFYGEDQNAITQQVSMMEKLIRSNASLIDIQSYLDERDMNDVWQIRKKGLGLLMGQKTKVKPIAFIEDSSIPLEHLSKYIEQINKKCSDLKVPVVVYAHASVGVLHVRPILDLTLHDDIEKMKELSQFVFELVQKYGGSWSGEHGDGRVRSSKMERFYGEEVYSFLKKMKSIADPKNIFNPGVIVDADEMDQNLRLGEEYKDSLFDTQFLYKKDGSFQSIVHNCSGIGACLNMDGNIMCPSFRATKEEKDNTRGRANTLRLAMSGQLPSEDLAGEKVASALENCLSCKACKSECPSNVDMAKLKSEVLQLRYDHKGTPLSVNMASKLRSIGRVGSGPLSFVSNFIMRNVVSRKIQEQLFGIESKRKFPTFSNRPFTKIKNQNHSNTKVVGIFGDCYSRYFETDLGRTTSKLLHKLGYHIELLDYGCCQRPAISNGLLRKAKKQTKTLATKLQEYPHDIIVLEPSCLSAVSTDIPDLHEFFEGKDNMYSLAEFILKRMDDLPQLETEDEFIVHGHCHEQSLRSTDSIVEVLHAFGLNAQLLDTGCCGMAGNFGMMKKTYDVSQKVAEVSLLPFLHKHPKAKIVATGFSCRHQIEDFSDRQSKHWIEYVDQLLDKKPEAIST